MKPTAHIVAGLGFGDEGKGAVVDYLCREQDFDTVVVKYTGGPQASHTVVLPDGRHHRFAQFGSGTFQPNCRTHIARHVLVEPWAMLNEDLELRHNQVKDALDRISVDDRCVIITPWHEIGNRIREALRGADRHGSCGMGIGECKQMLASFGGLRVGDLFWQPSAIKQYLAEIRDEEFRSLPAMTASMSDDVKQLYEEFDAESMTDLMDIYDMWVHRISINRHPRASSYVFEGSQGVLLDEQHGFAPYNTWSDTTFKHALELCGQLDLQPRKIGILRTYMTRHGAGPFVTEDNASVQFPDHNKPHAWQGNFRQGYFDAVMGRYAIDKCGGIDELILTHMDRVTSAGWDYCNHYFTGGCFVKAGLLFTADQLNAADPVVGRYYGDVPSFVSKLLDVSVKTVSYGPSYTDFKRVEN